jgi:hypothetical protein
MPWRRDANDQRIARTVRQQYGTLVDFVGANNQPTEYITNASVVGVRGWPALVSEGAPTDTDSDGMPDYWELGVGLNPNLATDRNLTNVLTGYTRLEEYLNWLAEAHVLCDKNGTVDVNLRTATGGATNLAYTITNGTNGTVSLLGDGYTARFMATHNYSGLAGFVFNATDPANSSTFGPVTVGVLVSITNAPNTPPTLAAISNRTVVAGTIITFNSSASDAEAPPQTLTFTLLEGPTNAALNSSNGAFEWRPLVSQSPSTNALSIVVTDSGVPNLSATQSFTLSVLRPAAPALQQPALSAGQFGFGVSGDAGPDYTIQASTNLANWINLFTTNSPGLPFDWSDPAASNHRQRFYRVLLGP